MKNFNIEFIGEQPKYIQVEKCIKNMIDEGSIEDGEQLPSIRTLCQKLKVNSVTIVSAYKKLEQEGYAVQIMGSGTYAKKRDNNLSFKREYSNFFKKLNYDTLKEYIDFTGETTGSSYFPVNTFKNVLNQVIDRDGASAFMYKEPLGYEGLRKSINKHFWNNSREIDDILIVSGAQQGIDIISKSIINVNDNIIVEKPTYSGALSVFKWRRANIFEVKMEHDGIDIVKMEKILKKVKIKCFYAMSYFQNPTGISYSLEKKKKILELANKYDFYIIEDDYLSELIYDDNITYESFKSLDEHNRVIYIKSFSKIFLPGLRMGYLIAPISFRESIQNSKINTDISTSSLMQRALDLYINEGLWEEHIKYLNNIYREYYEFLVDRLTTQLSSYISFNDPKGGLSLYIKINANINSMEFFYQCKKRKVLITPGVFFYKNYRDGEKYFRLGFSIEKKEEIEKGIKIFKEIFTQCESFSRKRDKLE